VFVFYNCGEALALEVRFDFDNLREALVLEIVIDFDNRGETLVLKSVGQRVVDIIIESFYHQAEVGKQTDRVFLVLKKNLSEVEHVRIECLWF
jgi:hypothetical protein